MLEDNTGLHSVNVVENCLVTNEDNFVMRSDAGGVNNNEVHKGGSSKVDNECAGFEDVTGLRSLVKIQGHVDNFLDINYVDKVGTRSNASDLLFPKLSGSPQRGAGPPIVVAQKKPKESISGTNPPGGVAIDVGSLSRVSTASGLDLYHRVRFSGVPNYVDCRVPVPSGIKVAAWYSLLDGYHDVVVAQYMEFGWPIGAYGSIPPSPDLVKNHTDALKFTEHVERYIHKEVSLGATMGPFANNPLPGVLHLSPINTVPKKDSPQRRVIVDLSYPHGSSVNDAIDKAYHEGAYSFLQYPSTDDLAGQVADAGVGCLAFKRDLSRAYRQIPVCPAEYGYLGFGWKGQFYIDRVLPFGLRSAANICQRVSAAVAHVVEARGFKIINYLDDFAGAQVAGVAHDAFKCLGNVLDELGLQESEQKAVAPATVIEFLGVEFNTVTLEMKITPERIAEILDLVETWLNKKTTRRKDLESLLGKLLFVSRVVPPGRLFVARLLEFLRAVPRGKSVSIPCQI